MSFLLPPRLAFSLGLLVFAAACAESSSKFTEDTSPGAGGSAGISGAAGSGAGGGNAGAGGSEAGAGGTAGSGGAGAGGSAGGDGGSAVNGGSAGGGAAGEGGSGGAGAAGSGAGAAGDAGAGGSAGDGGAAGTGGSAGSAAGTGGGACTGKVVINEVSPEGTTGNDDFVELYNPESCPADIGGWKLDYLAATATSSTSPIPLWKASANQTLPAGGFLVLGTSAFTGDADGELSSGLKQEGGGVALKTSGGQVVDSVAWGDAVAKHPFIEGTVCSVIGPGKSGARIPDGKDTQNNQSDFTTPSTRTPGATNF